MVNASSGVLFVIGFFALPAAQNVTASVLRSRFWHADGKYFVKRFF